MPEASSDLAPPSHSVRVEPATIEDLPALTQLVAELMDAQDDFTPDHAAHHRGIRLILEEPKRRLLD